MWFNQVTTQPGLDALGWYHEKKDDKRQIGLGPEHDWSSHAADAYGLICVAYEEPKAKEAEKKPPRVAQSWMG
jgi:phage terminase large subunit